MGILWPSRRPSRGYGLRESLRTVGSLAVLSSSMMMAAGCSPTPASSRPSFPAPSAASDFSLKIANIDGPPVDVVVNGRVVAHVTCQVTSTDPAPVLVPKADDPLPWTVDLKRADGRSLGTWTETGTRGPRMLLIRGSEAAELPAVTPAGRVPTSSCPP